MIDDALTGTVIGCAMDVHRELGPGYLEKVYENALAIALSDAGIGVAQQVAVPAQFRGRVVGDFVADLLVEGNLIVELKAVSNLLSVHETQLVSYLKATGFDVGLLINFGAGSLQVKRKYREYRPALATNQDRITGFSGFTGSVLGPGPGPASALATNQDRITGFSGFTGSVSRSPVDPANSGIPSQNAAPGGTGPENGIPKTNLVNPANPAILSKTPEQGGAWIPKNNPVHPANPAILSKTPEQGDAVAETGIPKNNPVNPANPAILSLHHGARQ
jgi:GxxExxY protein